MKTRMPRITAATYSNELFRCLAATTWLLLVGMTGPLPPTHGDVEAIPNPAGRNLPRRTWEEVQREIQQVFTGVRLGCYAVEEKLPQSTGPVGFRIGESYRPTTSVMDMEVKRHPRGEPEKTVIILEISVERDFSIELGQASSYRIAPKIVRDEGQLMLKEIVSLFQKKQWPYEVIDTKKKGTQQKDSGRKTSALESRPIGNQQARNSRTADGTSLR